MSSVLFIYTLLLLSVWIYLLVLRILRSKNYIKYHSEFWINFEFYLLIFYFLAFLISLFITLYIYSAELLGTLIGRMIVDCPELILNKDVLVVSDSVKSEVPKNLESEISNKDENGENNTKKNTIVS